MNATGTSPVQERHSKGGLLPALCAWSFVILLVVVSILATEPPQPLPISSPPTDFSAERAMAHLKVIARVSHPIGSASHAAVRDYLMGQLSALNLQPAVSTGFATRTFSRTIVAAEVQDIVARMSGSANSRAVLLMAHYDSVNHAPGAGDDGSGVAAILETMRALREGPRLKNDVIVLFTDGEEEGLLGAQAFVAGHPWMKDIGLVMNFEARGDQGPSLLFETSANNRSLIENVARSAPYPMGSSLFYSLYKLLPNDTDFSVFRPSHVPGLNFAFGARLEAYHTELDTVENISLASIQHHGSYALSLTRRFADTDLDHFQRVQGNDIFFNWLGSRLVTYSERWVLVGQIALSVLLLLTLFLNLRSGQAGSKVWLGCLACLSLLLVIPGVLWLASWIVGRMLAGHAVVGDSPASAWLLTGYTLLGGFAGTLLISLFRRWLRVAELSLGGLLLLALFNWGIALELPGGSYLFFWPLLLTGGGLFAIAVARKDAWSFARTWATMPGTAAALLLLSPFVYLLYIFLTLQPVTVIAIGFLVGALLITCVPVFDVAIPRGRPQAVLALLLAGLTALIIGTTQSRHTSGHPERDNLLYALNANDHTAAWISNDLSADPWTSQFLTNKGQPRRPMPDYLGGSQRAVLSAPAETRPFLPPRAIITSDEKDGELRKVRLTVKSQRSAGSLSLVFNREVQPVSVRVAGIDAVISSNSAGFTIRLLGTADRETELQLTLKAPAGAWFWLTDESIGLPGPLPPRPSNYIAAPASDLTLVSVKYALKSLSSVGLN
jgi:hypothetical protein